MTAANRLATLFGLQANELCARAETALDELADVMNRETTLLRAGHYQQAAALTAQKTQLAQDYAGISRAVKHERGRLKAEAPEDLARLKSGHERLATQIAQNLRVLATARSVTGDLLADVAASVGKAGRTHTYGASGQISSPPGKIAAGIAVNRAL